MKICHFGAGNSSHVQRWIQWFIEKGHENHLITDNNTQIHGASIHVLPSFRELDTRKRLERFKDWSFNHWRLRYLRILKWARDQVNEINPDIVHSHMLWYPGMLGAFVPSKRYVLTVFNGDVSWRKDRTLINRMGVHYAIHKADAITSVSQNLLEDCRRWGARKRKLHRIMRGVDLGRFHPVNDRVALRLSLGMGSGPMILSPRSAGKLYNLDTILLAIPEVVKHFQDAQFVFIWQSAEEKEVTILKNLAAGLNIEQHVSFVGNVPYEKVHLYNQAADVMVSVPSYDGVSSSILEAMSCGAVPVASNLSTTREWVEHNKSGLLVTPGDADRIAKAILTLLSNKEHLNNIAQRNIEMMKLQGGQDMWMERVESLYLSLLGESKL